MKAEIEQALQPLIGLPLTDMWRPFGSQRFEFGEQHPAVNRRGEPITFGDYALSVTCEWRIIAEDRIILGETDYPTRLVSESAEEPDEPGYEWPGAGEGPCHSRVKALFQLLETDPPIVEAIVADAVGSVYFTLSKGYRLEVLPTYSLPEDYWCLLQPQQETPWFVVKGEGVERWHVSERSKRVEKSAQPLP